MPSRALTSKVSSKHEVKHKKAVFVVLEGISQVDDERVIDLWECDDYGDVSKTEGWLPHAPGVFRCGNGPLRAVFSPG